MLPHFGEWGCHEYGNYSLSASLRHGTVAQAEHIVEECVIPNVVAWGSHESGSHARRDSAERFSRLDALLYPAIAWIFIPAYCFAIP